MNQSVLHRKHSQNYSIVQVNENEVAIHRTGDNKDRYKKSIEAGINIAGLDVFGNTVALWSGKKVEVYSLEDGDDGVKRIGTFHLAPPAVLYRNNAYLLRLVIMWRREICLAVPS